jgi:photosystem II stability/assembly factor-like uncharacterized protein
MLKRCAYASLAAAMVAATVVALAGAAPVRTSQSGWTWGSPLPQGNALTAIDFAGGRGYAVGEFGTIIRTDDGGANWSGVRTGLTDDLTELRVIDADAFVAGGGCTLLRSLDGGTTIRRVRFNPSSTCGSPLAAMHFPTRDIGYLVRGDGSVLRTDDGGSRFSSGARIPAASGGPPNDAWFTDANNGVVATGTDTLGKIYRTADAGASWTEVASSAAIRGIHFVSSNVGYAVGQNTVLKTENGGAIWVPQGSPAANLRSVRCADANNCVVTTTSNTVLYTDDGFATAPKPATYAPACDGCTPPEGAVNGAAAAFQSATRVVAVGRPSDTAISNDAGKTFLSAYSNLPGGYSRLRLTSPSTAFAPGEGGSVARTTDSGATWTRVGVPTTDNVADVVDVAFPTSSLGYAVDSAGAVFRTDNGGGSWAILGESGVRPRAMTASPDGNVVMLVGPRGMRRSANAGANFDPVESKAVASADLDDVDRTGDGVIYVHGKRAIAFSTNEGQSWKTIKRPGRSSILQLDFVDRKTGFLLAADGRVWKTGNRGARWTEVFTTGFARPNQIAFGDSQNGYLAIDEFANLDAGWIMHTSDGGASWRPQLISQSFIGSGAGPLVAAPGGVAYALVGSNEMKATTTGGDAAEPSSLTLSTKSRSLRRKAKIRIDGRLNPSAPGARVEVVMRDATNNRVSRQFATVRSDGKFSANFTVSRTSYFVAQWAGDSDRNSDGSPALRVQVGRR